MSATTDPQPEKRSSSWTTRGAFLFATAVSATITGVTYLVMLLVAISGEKSGLPAYMPDLIVFAFGYAAILLSLTIAMRKKLGPGERLFSLGLSAAVLPTLPLAMLMAG